MYILLTKVNRSKAVLDGMDSAERAQWVMKQVSPSQWNMLAQYLDLLNMDIDWQIINNAQRDLENEQY
jgi:hypothetical protein